MTTIQKTNHVLPEEVTGAFEALRDSADIDGRDRYLVALRNQGWTLQSLATGTGLTRERVRQIVLENDMPTYTGDLPVPTPPAKPEKARPVYIEPSEDILARLLELQPQAQQVRSNSPKYRAEAEEYTRLLWQAHRPVEDGGEGVTLYRLAKRLGVTHGALRFRLARYGYKKPKTGHSKVYAPIMEKNRTR